MYILYLDSSKEKKINAFQKLYGFSTTLSLLNDGLPGCHNFFMDTNMYWFKSFFIILNFGCELLPGKMDNFWLQPCTNLGF